MFATVRSAVLILYGISSFFIIFLIYLFLTTHSCGRVIPLPHWFVQVIVRPENEGGVLVVICSS